jgi:hypothetical protein
MYHSVAAQSSFMTAQKADATTHVQKLVLVVKMAIVLEGCTIEEQPSVVRFIFIFFCGQKDSMQRKFIKKCFLFTVGSVCRLKQFTILSRKVPNISPMTNWLKRGRGSGLDNSQKTSMRRVSMNW